MLGDLSRSRCLDGVGLAFGPGLLDPEDFGYRTHFWTLKAAGDGVRGRVEGVMSDQRLPQIMAYGGQQTETPVVGPLQRGSPDDSEMRFFCLIKIVTYLDGPHPLTIPNRSTCLRCGIWELLPFSAPWFLNAGPGLLYGSGMGQCWG